MKYRRPICVLLFVAAGLLAGRVAAQPATRPTGQLNAATMPSEQRQVSDFQFAIVPDAHGGNRPGVFESALDKVNLMRPALLMSVGDLIGTGGAPSDKLASQYDYLLKLAAGVKVPFFYVAGNHDAPQRKEWQDRFGSPWYSFKFRGVLFLILDSMDGSGQSIGAQQLAFVRGALKDSADARWTMVFVHHPLWRADVNGGADKNGWGQVEELLKDRKYTVFAGHVHTYSMVRRNGMKYFTLATAGGRSTQAGPAAGQFDHIMWVTMTDDGPVIANLTLDGILRESPTLIPPLTLNPTTRPGPK